MSNTLPNESVSNPKHTPLPAGNLGKWEFDSLDLPRFAFEAELPVITREMDGSPVAGLSTDPWFLLGNNRMTLFPHVSGLYQLLSLERSIARLNYGGAPNTGANVSRLTIAGTNGASQYELVCAQPEGRIGQCFGCGYASYDHRFDGIKVRRGLSTPPSFAVNDGVGAILIALDIENTSADTLHIEWEESLTACYDFTFRHNAPAYNILTTYPVRGEVLATGDSAVARFSPTSVTPLATGVRGDVSVAEGFPPELRIHSLHAGGSAFVENMDNMSLKMGVRFSQSLAAGASLRLAVAVGYVDPVLTKDWPLWMEKLSTAVLEKIPFQKDWRRRLPVFEEETDPALRMEMQWHAHTLFAMTNWHDDSQEIYVPQGNIYEYGLGVAAATGADHAMQTCVFNHLDPEFSKSQLRQFLCQIDTRGHVNPSFEGAGRIPQAPWQKSHSNLYALWAICEYLETTQHASFLSEEVSFFGTLGKLDGTVLDRIRRCFLYLRDEISVGNHGLVRMLLADWNDALYFLYEKENFFSMFAKGESYPNTAMAVQFLVRLTDVLQSLQTKADPSVAAEIPELCRAMMDFRNALWPKLLAAISQDGQIPRAYLGSGTLIGDDNLFLEPFAYAMGISALPHSLRHAMWGQVSQRLMAGEIRGPRQCEVASDAWPKGDGENGGFWYSLNGALLAGLIDVDREAAWTLLKRMSLMAHSSEFPNQWVGMWSGPDCFDSSLSNRQGHPRPYGEPFPVFCAHAHSWLLLNYFKLCGFPLPPVGG